MPPSHHWTPLFRTIALRRYAKQHSPPNLSRTIHRPKWRNHMIRHRSYTSQRRGGATYLNTLYTHCSVCSSSQASQAFLNWPKQIYTSLTSFQILYHNIQHKISKNKGKKIKNKNFKNLMISKFCKSSRKIKNIFFFK